MPDETIPKDETTTPEDAFGGSKHVSLSNIEKLDATNYGRWKNKVRVAMEISNCWDQCQNDAANAQLRPNWKRGNLIAKNIILNTVSRTPESLVSNCNTAYKMWTTLEEAFSDVTQLNLQQTLNRFHTFTVPATSTGVEAFYQMQNLSCELKELDIEQPEASIVSKLVTSLPLRFNGFKRAWALLAQDDRTMSRVLAGLKEEDSMQKLEKSAKALTIGSSPSAFRLEAEQGKRKKRTPEEMTELKKKTKCHRCQRTGHWKSECRSGSPKGNQDNRNRKEDAPKPSFETQQHRAFQLGADMRENSFLADSGSSAHVVNTFNWFQPETYQEFQKPISMATANGEAVQALGQGTVHLEAFIQGKWIPSKLHQVWYAPEASTNLVSEGQLDISGYVINQTEKGVRKWVLNGTDGPTAILEGAVYRMLFRATSLKDNLAETHKHRLMILKASPENQMKYWHATLAHVNPAYICKTFETGAVTGGPSEEELKAMKHYGLGKCESCVINKITRASFPANPRRATEVGQLMHCDLSGRSRVRSLGGYNYFLVCKDDATSFRQVYFQKEKSQSFENVKAAASFIETQTGHKLKTLKTDGGGEFCSAEMKQFCNEQGIRHEVTVARCPEANARVERDMRTLKEAARTMLNESKLPVWLWGEAVAYAVVVLNRTLNKVATKKTAYEQVLGQKPDLSDLQPFGTRVIFYPNSGNMDSWSIRGSEGFIVGWRGRGIYRIYDAVNRKLIDTNKVVIMQDVKKTSVQVSSPLKWSDEVEQEELASNQVSAKKDENYDKRDDDWDEELFGTPPTEDMPEEQEANVLTPANTEQPQSTSTQAPETAQDDDQSLEAELNQLPEDFDDVLEINPTDDDVFESPQATPVRAPPVRAPERPLVVPVTQAKLPVPVRPTSSLSKMVTVNIKDGKRTFSANVPTGTTTSVQIPTRTRPLSRDSFGQDRNVLRDQKRVDYKEPRIHALQGEEATVPDPVHFKDAVNSPDAEEWWEAMGSEWTSLLNNETFVVVPRPDNGNVLKSRWVYKTKLKTDGSLDKRKARIVCLGFQQKYGIDFEETFSPVARYESIRLLLGIAAAKGMEIVSFDVSTAFLNAELTETTYIEQPAGFQLHPKNKVLLLKRALYGLRQAPRAWNTTFNDAMLEIKMMPLQEDPCIYIGSVYGEHVYLSLYVDDGLVMSNSYAAIQYVMRHLESKFKMTQSDATSYVGLEITKGAEGQLHISQGSTIRKMLDRYNMSNCNTAAVPLQPSVKLEKVDGVDDSIPYRQILGSLNWLATTTRPDISFAVGYLSRFNQGYDASHFNAAKNVLRYLKGTIDAGITFVPSDSLHINGFVDGDWGGDIVTRQSTAGVLMLLNGAPIIWSSKKIPSVCLSVTESEYCALSRGAQDCLWIKKILAELQMPVVDSIPIYSDSLGAIAIATNAVHHAATKHISIRIHFVRQLVNNKTVKIQHIDGTTNPADCFTKALHRPKFQTAVEMLGMDPKPSGVRDEDKKAEAKVLQLGKRRHANLCGFLPKMYLMMSLLATVYTSGLCFHGIPTGPSVSWRRLDTPVIQGTSSIEINIKLINTCDVLKTGNYTTDYWQKIIRMCETEYKALYQRELSLMCPQTDLIESPRERRELVTIAVITVVGLVVSAIAGTAITMSVVSNRAIGALDAKLQAAILQQESSKARDDAMLSFITELAKTIELMDKEFKDEKDRMSGQTRISLLLGFLSARLVTANLILKEARLKWNLGQLHQPFFDMFNMTIPCGTACPFEIGRPESCSYDPVNEKLIISIQTPLINPDLQVLEADPFVILQSHVLDRNETVCFLEWSGPAFLIYSRKNKCIVRKSSIRPSSFIPVHAADVADCLAPEQGVESMRYFKMTRCTHNSLLVEEDWSQIKIETNRLLIYCPFGNITFDNTTQACPNEVLAVNRGAPVSVNGQEYEYRKLKMGGTVLSDPLITFKANYYLKPSAPTTALEDDLRTDLMRAHQLSPGSAIDPSLMTVDYEDYWWMHLTGWVILLAICVGVLFALYRSRAKIQRYRTIKVEMPHVQAVHADPTSVPFVEVTSE